MRCFQACGGHSHAPLLASNSVLQDDTAQLFYCADLCPRCQNRDAHLGSTGEGQHWARASDLRNQRYAAMPAIKQ